MQPESRPYVGDRVRVLPHAEVSSSVIGQTGVVTGFVETEGSRWVVVSFDRRTAAYGQYLSADEIERIW